MNKYVLKCTCHLAKEIDRSAFYGCKRVCNLHKWQTVKGNKQAPTEENDSISYENELIEKYNSLPEGAKLIALKSLFKKGKKVKGNYYRDYGNRGIDKNPIVIKTKKLACKLACIYGYGINPLSV